MAQLGCFQITADSLLAYKPIRHFENCLTARDQARLDQAARWNLPFQEAAETPQHFAVPFA